MAQEYYESSEYKNNLVNISAMLSILKKTLHIFNNVQELMRGVVIFEHIGFGQRV